MPLTLARREYSLAKYVQREHTKPVADVFVSFTWSYTWGQLLSALEGRTEYVWLDVFTVNQHGAAGVGLDDWLAVFGDAIKAIGRVAIVLAPWDAPIPISRAWCIFEWLVTHQKGQSWRNLKSRCMARLVTR